MVIGVSFGGMVARIRDSLSTPGRKACPVLHQQRRAGGASYPLHEVKDFLWKSTLDWSSRLADNSSRRSVQAAHQQEFQTLLKDTLTGLQVGADEPGRAMARRQAEARKDHDTYAAHLADAGPHLRRSLRRHRAVNNQEAMLKQIPNAKLELFAGGHLFFVQDPKPYERIVAFLQDKERK